MNTNLKNSIDRAINLLGTPANYEKYVSFKISPIPKTCCCVDCLPNTWGSINKLIFPCGPVKHGGDVLIKENNENFILESHESGPEIIVYLKLAAASISLIAAVIKIITVLLKALQDENRKRIGKLEITSRRQIKGRLHVEEIMKIDLPLSKSIIKKLNDTIKNAMEERDK